MKEKLTKKFWIALVVFSLIGQVAWVVENMYFNVFIYNIFNASPEDISLMVSASAVSATLTTIFIGALSDKIGKRKIFIAGGYILWGISILAFSLVRLDIISGLFPMVASASTVGITLVIILDCVMTFFGSSANDAAFNAWLTDSTNSSNRGSAEGVNAMVRLSGLSHAQLCRNLKKANGKTPQQMLKELRLSYAYELICSSEIPYEEIATSVGYSSFSHFSVTFKERYGITPSVLRKTAPQSMLL